MRQRIVFKPSGAIARKKHNRCERYRGIIIHAKVLIPYKLNHLFKDEETDALAETLVAITVLPHRLLLNPGSRWSATMFLLQPLELV